MNVKPPADDTSGVTRRSKLLARLLLVGLGLLVLAYAAAMIIR
jgi:hypothetical protein